MNYLGIDNGLTGGLILLGGEPGEILAHSVMPTRGKSKGNEVDASSLYHFINGAKFHHGELTIILETPGKFAKGVQAISSMWDSYGAIRGVIECMGFRHHRITPQSWQKTMLVGCAKGDTKPAALAAVKRLWPSESWLASPRCSKPHEGLIDAALIAEHARRLKL